jgi:phosphoribosylformylglycinamidine synthase
MLAIVTPENLDAVLELALRWEVRAEVVGRVNDTGRFRVFNGVFDAWGVPGEQPAPPIGEAPISVSSDREPEADVPAGSLGDGPVYHRPRAVPSDLAERQADDPAPMLREKFAPGTDLTSELLALLATPTIAEKRWVWSQYDHQLFLNTVVAPGADAAVLRVKETTKGLALSTDGKARFCRLDPRTGGRLVVLEAARNVACSGAVPRALVNCLNFGNPEHPEVMWQFAEAVEGIAEACEALGIPVVGGNVSFYNESRGTDIDPTPVVAVIGVVDDLARRPPTPRFDAGDHLVVLGTTDAELGGSEWASVLHGYAYGLPPRADLDRARALHDVVAALVRDGRASGIHDCADGGLAVALAEMAFGAQLGFDVDLARAPGADACTPAEQCFSESTSRVVVATSDVAAVLERAATAGVPAAEIGIAGGDRLRVSDAFDAALADAHHTWANGLTAALGIAG